jgi:hypothetical protein
MDKQSKFEYGFISFVICIMMFGASFYGRPGIIGTSVSTAILGTLFIMYLVIPIMEAAKKHGTLKTTE